MKLSIAAFLILSLCACSSNKKVEVENTLPIPYSIVEIQIESESVSSTMNEIHFHEINSALDGMKMMYDNYGDWSQKMEGKYQDNISQFIWQGLTILDNGKQYTIIADGTETDTAYFAALMVFDDYNKDCLDPNYPNREAIVDFLVEKMTTLEYNSKTYNLFR